MTLHAEIIGDAERLTALEPEWWALWHAAPESTPFQSPAWLIPWWRNFEPGRLATLAIHDGGRLAGLAPLYLENGPHGRRLVPLGIGISDYLDLLLAPGRADVAAAMAEAAGQIPDWQSLELEELAPGAAAFRLPCPRGCMEHEYAHSSCPGLTLGKEVDASGLPFAITGKKRQSFRRCSRVAAGEGELELISPEPSAFLEALVALHGERWAGRGEHGVLADPQVQAFHAEALPRLHTAGLTRLTVVRIEGRPVAAYYRLSWRDRSAAYLGGFDPAFAHQSPMTVLIGDGFRAAHREGVREFSFLRGGEDYKYLWGAEDRWNRRRSFRRAS
ncbi:MAG TPA: GNAT family N-acetyltransferase [Devosiaceae bacterium]|nr:GNAT family N-acetyltransferase [Devosiaceae bacterium]